MRQLEFEEKFCSYLGLMEPCFANKVKQVQFPASHVKCHHLNFKFPYTGINPVVNDLQVLPNMKGVLSKLKSDLMFVLPR
jgi:hypothetical protein